LRAVFGVGQDIRNVDGAAVDYRAPEDSSAIRLRGIALEIFAVLRGEAEGRGNGIDIALAPSNEAGIGLAQLGRRLNKRYRAQPGDRKPSG
jgi:hypothetical protein